MCLQRSSVYSSVEGREVLGTHGDTPVVEVPTVTRLDPVLTSGDTRVGVARVGQPVDRGHPSPARRDETEGPGVVVSDLSSTAFTTLPSLWSGLLAFSVLRP